MRLLCLIFGHVCGSFYAPEKGSVCCRRKKVLIEPKKLEMKVFKMKASDEFVKGEVIKFK